MPYKSGKLKGQLTSSELRKLISAHNKLYTIKVPSGATQPQIVKLINDNGYSVNHKTQQLRLRFKDLPKKITKDDAPKKKVATELEKQKKEEKKKERDDKKKKEIREIKKQALKEDADRKKKISKPKKQDEVRPKEKVGRPKFDPKNIEVIKKKSSPKPRRKLKGRLTSVRKEKTMELEKLFPEFYAEDRELSMRTMGYVRDVLSVYQKIKSIGTTTQKTEARKIYEMFSAYRGDDKSQFDSYKKQFESILTKPKSKPEPKATIKKVVSKPQEPPKKENTYESKGQEIKELFTKALSPELKKAYESKDKAKMKTTFNKAVKILSEYLGKTSFAGSVPQAKRGIVNGMLGRVIKNFGEGKELKEPLIFRKIDLSDVYNRLN